MLPIRRASRWRCCLHALLVLAPALPVLPAVAASSTSPLVSAGVQRGPDRPKIGIAPVVLDAPSYTFDTSEQHGLRATVLVRGLKHPFAIAVLPNGDALVSERKGALRLVHEATGANGRAARLDPQPVSGVPSLAEGRMNGGLHDVVLHPQFASNRWVYFTYTRAGRAFPPDARGAIEYESVLSLWRGRLSESGLALTDVREVFAADPGTISGSRIAFGRDGSLYMTSGAPFADQSQRLDTDYGKVLRLKDDGTVPADNPFVGRAGARPEIFSYGHRDHIGIAVDPASGAVLNAEFGPNGGDEVNRILPGRNYGWPLATFGRRYEGPRWTESPVREGVEAPLIVWLPSISPHGLAFYAADRFPAWKGNLFVAFVQRGETPHTGGIERVVFNAQMEELRRESLLTELHQRIGDVRQGPDGLLYVLTDEDDGAVLRLEPGPLDAKR